MTTATVRPQFLILHGWQNRRPTGHWEHWLADRLIAAGHDVSYPQLPEPDLPVLKDWLAVIEHEITRRPHTEHVVIAHSLSVVAWLHLVDQGSVHLPVSRALLVAPPSPQFLAATSELREFELPAQFVNLARASSVTPPRIVCSDNDPYCQPPADTIYQGGLDVDRLDGAGHLDMVAGYGPWWSALRWCEDPAYRLNAD